jgi:mannose-6-phosphate isomerase-like protein (cupin superfamily)
MKISFQTTLKRFFEAVLVLALVLIFFLIILVSLNTVFPTGQNLFDLIRSGDEDFSLSDNKTASRKLQLSIGTDEFGLDHPSEIAALLSKSENQVKSKRSNQIAWKGTREGMTFFNNDAIQTFTRSSATLSVKNGNLLKLGENSLVVFRKLEQDVFTRENRTVVVLMGGQLNGEVTQVDQEYYNLEIIAPGAVVRAPSRSNNKNPTKFQMIVRPDNSSVLTVFEGKANLTVGGETIEVGTDQVVKVKPGKRPVFMLPPPEPPALVSPARNEIFTFREVPPKVLFKWNANGNVQSYHFVLAADAGFEEILYETRGDDRQFAHGNLKSGEYFWRVSAESEDGEGDFSRTRYFQLIQDLEPPALEVNYPDTGQKGDKFVLSGRTDPDASIFVGGMPVKIDERGEFIHNLFLKRGFNVIVVEAVDSLGNVAYFSKTVNVVF